MISLEQARKKIGELVPLAPERIGLSQALGRVCHRDIVAVTDCPSVSASLKDGYAVRSGDVDRASPDCPVVLRCQGTATAGGDFPGRVGPGQTVRIMTGAPVPAGADAVLSSEFARQEGGRILALANARPGRNILEQGSDIRAGEVAVTAGTRLGPADLGLLAAAGIGQVDVHGRPRVAVVATGTELVAPGETIARGRIAASNLVTLVAALADMGIRAEARIIRDDLESLHRKLAVLADNHDLILTCGGVLDGDRDFTLSAMDRLGVEPIFRRVRMGPGKGACLGRRAGCLFLNLPGGPPSNHVAWLLLARPAVQRLCGWCESPTLVARLTRPVKGRRDWSQLVYARLDRDGAEITVTPLAGMTRLETMARADCLLEIPDGCAELAVNTLQKVWKIR